MLVERTRGDPLDRTRDGRTDGDIRDEVPVHHVDVGQIDAVTLRRTTRSGSLGAVD